MTEFTSCPTLTEWKQRCNHHGYDVYILLSPQEGFKLPIVTRKDFTNASAARRLEGLLALEDLQKHPPELPNLFPESLTSQKLLRPYCSELMGIFRPKGQKYGEVLSLLYYHPRIMTCLTYKSMFKH